MAKAKKENEVVKNEVNYAALLKEIIKQNEQVILLLTKLKERFV